MSGTVWKEGGVEWRGAESCQMRTKVLGDEQCRVRKEGDVVVADHL